jgi:large subunit ribosomal protein L22
MATTQESAREFLARHRYARITARKARLIADEIRGKSVNQALELLAHTPLRAAPMYLKVLRSAVANASQTADVNVNQLLISDARADDGPLMQGRMRWRAGPQGRAMPFRKVTSHLTVRLREVDEGGRKGRKRGAKAAKQGEAPAQKAAGAEQAAQKPSGSHTDGGAHKAQGSKKARGQKKEQAG